MSGRPPDISMAPLSRVPRIALVVGDTAGHTYPALAVAHAFRERHRASDLLFLGIADSPATSILASQGERLVNVPGAPLRRTGLAGAGNAMTQAARAIQAARTTLRRHDTQLAIGFGGFASGGVLIGARSLGVRTAIHEANVEPGLANSWLRPVVDRIYLAHRVTRLPGVHVGMPVRKSIAAFADHFREPPRNVFRVLVTSGSRGASFFARHVPRALSDLARRGVTVEVRQQADGDEAIQLRRAYAASAIDADIRPHFEDMGDAYWWAHVALARGGGNTIAELACTSLPAVIVPLADAAANHQLPNARLWANGGAGVCISEPQWNNDEVTDWLHSLATSPGRWRQISLAARTLAEPDATRRLIDDCERLMGSAS